MRDKFLRRFALQPHGARFSRSSFDATPEFEKFKSGMKGLLQVPKARLDELVRKSKESSPRRGNPDAPGRKRTIQRSMTEREQRLLCALTNEVRALHQEIQAARKQRESEIQQKTQEPVEPIQAEVQTDAVTQQAIRDYYDSENRERNSW